MGDHSFTSEFQSMQQLLRESVEIKGFFPAISAPVNKVSSWTPSSRRTGAAAVAFLFIPPLPGEKYSRLVLTKRSLTVGTHKGQLGFAGGRCDPDDEDPVATAKREVEEEIGISQDSLRAHGCLEAQRSLSGSEVIPVIMTADLSEHDFVINTAEVDQIFLPSWNYFSMDHASEFSFNMFGVWRHSYLFSTPQIQVWGLTARIIKLAGLKP